MDPFSLLLIALLPLIPVWLIWMALFLANDPAKKSAQRSITSFSGPVVPMTRSLTMPSTISRPREPCIVVA
jgi:hypothetical protein